MCQTETSENRRWKKKDDNDKGRKARRRSTQSELFSVFRKCVQRRRRRRHERKRENLPSMEEKSRMSKPSYRRRQETDRPDPVQLRCWSRIDIGHCRISPCEGLTNYSTTRGDVSDRSCLERFAIPFDYATIWINDWKRWFSSSSAYFTVGVGWPWLTWHGSSTCLGAITRIELFSRWIRGGTEDACLLEQSRAMKERRRTQHGQVELLFRFASFAVS